MLPSNGKTAGSNLLTMYLIFISFGLIYHQEYAYESKRASHQLTFKHYVRREQKYWKEKADGDDSCSFSVPTMLLANDYL